jgi:hypothetical protein
MIYQTETKLQGWRALVIFEDRSECLLYVGRSTTQVRQNYALAYAEVLDDEERSRVRSITMQCWQGASDKGHWVTKGTLSVPGRKPAAASSESGRKKVAVVSSEDDPDASADSEEPTPTILPFADAVTEAEQPAEPETLGRRKPQAAKQTTTRRASLLA